MEGANKLEHSLSETVIQHIVSLKNMDSERIVDLDKPLISYGVDSVTFIQLILRIEEEFDVEFDDSVLNQNDLSSINKIVMHLQEYLRKKNCEVL